MKIIFMGSPACAIESLKVLEQFCNGSEHQLIAVVSQPAAPFGRGKKLMDPPVAEWAKKRGYPILQPHKAKDSEFLSQLKELAPDIIITAAYGQILTEDFLAIPNRATINVHPSLLPKLRGATPVQSFLLTGAERTGVSVLFTVKALDAGNLICQDVYDCTPDQTSEDLLPILFRKGGELMKGAIDRLQNPGFIGEPQIESEVTHCRKIDKHDGLIDWTQLDAITIHNKFRAYTPWPGIYTHLSDKRISLEEVSKAPNDMDTPSPGNVVYLKKDKALLVGTREGAVLIKRLKTAGGKSVDAPSFWNGLKDKNEVSFHGGE